MPDEIKPAIASGARTAETDIAGRKMALAACKERLSGRNHSRAPLEVSHVLRTPAAHGGRASAGSADRSRRADRARSPEGGRPRPGARLLLRRARFRVDAAVRVRGGVHRG